ncbi:hypothetical protein [Aquibacillus kalidii]|uniref:hypothetical protein n=1 Tax=Aquibacillus kalidii TaxID=2762597 RepID=UPI0016459702|nr:hypothetical protein [Aquibacillus kalidii]
MKKGLFIFGFVIVIIVGFIFVNKSYYPPLPIENLTAKEVIQKLKKSDNKVVEIAEEDETIWYITKNENEGIRKADENIKQMIISNGWEFKNKDGAGLFFKKNEERLVATTQMWSENYVLVKVDSKFKNP